MASVSRLPLLLLAIAPAPLLAQLTTHLSPQTDAAYDAYVSGAEQRMEWRSHLEPPAGGTVQLVPGADKSLVDVKDGLIHDWLAVALAPGAKIEAALALLQDYPDYKKNYSPEVTDSKVLSMEGLDWHIFLKLFKKKIMTAVLDTEYDVKYQPLGEGRWNIVSRSTRIAEVDSGKELMPGAGHGFLWRLNAYWLLEQRKEGVYMECRAISLSRDVPTGLGWMIKPIVTTVPKDSLKDTIEATLRALR